MNLFIIYKSGVNPISYMICVLYPESNYGSIRSIKSSRTKILYNEGFKDNIETFSVQINISYVLSLDISKFKAPKKFKSLQM